MDGRRVRDCVGPYIMEGRLWPKRARSGRSRPASLVILAIVYIGSISHVDDGKWAIGTKRLFERG
jgi:hypothetical protein